jgi:hypothetical protein
MIWRGLAALAVAAMLSACTDPYFGAGVEVRPGSVEVSPRVGGRVGGLTVGIEG